MCMNKQKNEEMEDIERLMSLVNSMKSYEGLSQKQKEKRIKYFIFGIIR